MAQKNTGLHFHSTDKFQCQPVVLKHSQDNSSYFTATVHVYSFFLSPYGTCEQIYISWLTEKTLVLDLTAWLVEVHHFWLKYEKRVWNVIVSLVSMQAAKRRQMPSHLNRVSKLKPLSHSRPILSIIGTKNGNITHMSWHLKISSALKQAK